MPGSQHMVDVTRLRPSTMYVFTVRARGAAGRLSPPSRAVRARTPAATAADRSAPTRPTSAGGRAVSSRAVQLTWGASRDDRGVASYDVYQGDVKIHSVGGNQTAAVVTGLRPGSRYVFTVRARDAADNLSPAGAPVRLTTPGSDDGRNTAPTGFTAATHRSGKAYYLDLAWDPPRTDGVITEYQIQLDGAAASSLVWGGTPPARPGPPQLLRGHRRRGGTPGTAARRDAAGRHLGRLVGAAVGDHGRLTGAPGPGAPVGGARHLIGSAPHARGPGAALAAVEAARTFPTLGGASDVPPTVPPEASPCTTRDFCSDPA
ncbi:fibronectin type III domain-containing protein [Streptomyces tricolor]|nr:fibronectin type III domain-containing protein [Streptomyces tricolor]